MKNDMPEAKAASPIYRDYIKRIIDLLIAVPVLLIAAIGKAGFAGAGAFQAGSSRQRWKGFQNVEIPIHVCRRRKNRLRRLFGKRRQPCDPCGQNYPRDQLG